MPVLCIYKALCLAAFHLCGHAEFIPDASGCKQKQRYKEVPFLYSLYGNGTFKEGLIKSARTICERIFITARRDFTGIIVFISRNRNKAVAKNPQSAADAFNQRFLKETLI